MRRVPVSSRRYLLWALPLLVAAGAIFLAASDLLSPPLTPQSNLQLGMPGDSPADALQRPENREFALKLRGILTAVGDDELVIRRSGRPDAVISITPQTSFALEGAPSTFDQLPMGGEALVIYDLAGQERVAMSVDVNPPGEGLPEREAIEPIVPEPPGTRLEGGLPPSDAPEMPPPEEPHKLPRDRD